MAKKLFARTVAPGGAENSFWQEIDPATGGAAYPPSTGIPKGDLDSEVRGLLAKASTAVQQETDPTVPDWAKTPAKPTYTAAEVGAIPADQKGVSVPTLVNGKVPLDQLPEIGGGVPAGGAAAQILRKKTSADHDTYWSDEAGGGGYSPPQGGIPRDDLAQGVQDSLDLADSALQEGDLPVPADFISSDAGNIIQTGADDKLFAAADDAINFPVPDYAGAISILSWINVTTEGSVTAPRDGFIHRHSKVEGATYFGARLTINGADPDTYRLNQQSLGAAYAYENTSPLYPVKQGDVITTQVWTDNVGVLKANDILFHEIDYIGQAELPSGGWQRTQLEAGVQASLGKADTAVQPNDLSTAISAEATARNTAIGNSAITDLDYIESTHAVRATKGDTSTLSAVLPMADEDTDGLMPKQAYEQVQKNKDDIAQLHGGTRVLRVAFTDVFSGSADPVNPTTVDILAYLQTLDPVPAPENVRLTDIETTNVWVYNTATSEFENRGVDTAEIFTNATAGLIKGSNTAGQVFAELDGTGSVVGWDALSTAVNGKQDKINASNGYLLTGGGTAGTLGTPINPATIMRTGTQIQGGTDLNDLTTAGHYYSSSLANTASILNKPSGINPTATTFILLVEYGGSGMAKQTFTVTTNESQYTDLIFTRVMWGNNWLPWIPVASRDWTNTLVNNAQFAVNIPDYANIESTNRITTNGGSWTADRNGFVFGSVSIGSINNPGYVASNLNINGKQISYKIDANPIVTAALYHPILPVKKGDVIYLVYTGGNGFVGTLSTDLRFIPPVAIQAPTVNETFSTTEIDTGKKWIDGKAIYRRAFTGTLTSSSFDIILFTLGGVNYSAVIASGGTLSGNGGGTSFALGHYYNSTNYSSIGVITPAFNTEIHFTGQRSGPNGPYNIWVEYVKTT